MKKILIISAIVKKVIILVMLLTSMSANAFYTTFEYDMTRLREGVMKQQKGTIEQKEAFLTKIEPVILKAKKDAYTRISSGCYADVARLCPSKVDDIYMSVKCLSDNKAKLSSSCKYVIKQNFRDDQFQK